MTTQTTANNMDKMNNFFQDMVVRDKPEDFHAAMRQQFEDAQKILSYPSVVNGVCEPDQLFQDIFQDYRRLRNIDMKSSNQLSDIQEDDDLYKVNILVFYANIRISYPFFI